MALQAEDLVMSGLGVRGDNPPNGVQPPLVDGIHLRWAFKRALGYPWYGFYLFRRLHGEGLPVCLSPALSNLLPGPWPATTLNAPFGQVSSDRGLHFTDDFPPGGLVEFDLEGRQGLRFTLPPGQPAWQVTVQVGFRNEARVEVTALSGNAPVVRTMVSGSGGDLVTARLEFDIITGLELGAGPAALVELCFVPVAQGATKGWEPVPDFPYPLCLPVFHPDYPCSGGLPVDRSAAENSGPSGINVVKVSP
jgi:hypothetical protein